MIFRPFHKDDTQGIIDLINNFFLQFDYEVDVETSEADLLVIPSYYPPDSFMVLEDENGVIRGTVAMKPCPDRETVCWMKRLYLDPSLHGTGEGERLLEWAYKQTRALGCMRIELWAYVGFSRAIRFYEKHGFVSDGSIHEMTDSYEPYDVYLYAKDLEQG